MPGKILVYDDNCPLCSWYSSLFVRYEFLEKEGRVPFSAIDPALLSSIDFNRSRNEIPLLNTSTGQVQYGIDALLELLSQKWSWIKHAGNAQPLNWLLRKLYKFISYNRKVIVAKKCGTGKIDCAPDYNGVYRYAFILFIWLLNSFLFSGIVSHAIVLFHLPGIRGLHFYGIAAIFLLLNILMGFAFKKQIAAEYLAQLGVSSLIISLILFTSLSIFSNKIVVLTFCCLALIAGAREYIRRMQYAGVLECRPSIAGANIISGLIVILSLAGLL
ncbi:MAG: DCC1-like thiol-disulfide oxidoreductase family protein [Chitinophagaceae bacterium]